MDKTNLVSNVSNIFKICGYKVTTSIKINHREIDVKAEETQGLVRKVILIECADYNKTVGVSKLKEDIGKLESAKEILKDNTIIMHVSELGYSPDASGYAADRGVEICKYEDLVIRMINFDSYIDAIENDYSRTTIMHEYQPNKIHYEGQSRTGKLSLTFFDEWLEKKENWLTLLGDYGVGKSWTLKRFLYKSIEEYKNNRNKCLLPFFIPLQKFTKAFDFENLILKTFQMYGLSGVHYSAFNFLMNNGKILFLLDSFDEMAQHLSRDVIRENLKELLVSISKNSKAIMTSRPNYFEGRAERLLVVEQNGDVFWHPLDKKRYEMKNYLSKTIKQKLEMSQFARINDLTIAQRKRLFKIVLGADSDAYKKLDEMLKKFDELGDLSNKAVIARLLTTVAETLSSSTETKTVDGYSLMPDDLATLNQSKIFEIIVYNLLNRDENIGTLAASERLLFLRSFAVFLQQRGRSTFATPIEIRELVRKLFEFHLRRSDSPERLLENLYRTCRRHSGLTTENQYCDTSGQIDVPVDEDDTDSNVGFSHNSLREYLIADTITDFIVNDAKHASLGSVLYNDLIGDFVYWKAEYHSNIVHKLKEKFTEIQESIIHELLFKVIVRFIQRKPNDYLSLLGKTPTVKNVDISGLDFSGMALQNGCFENCIATETDFRKSDLRKASFKKTILERVMLDGAVITEANFKETEIVSIYVYDEFDTNSFTVFEGKNARQWLHSRGALVHPTEDLNILLGKPWYEAAREVTRTICHRIAGSHQDVSLSKGTKKIHRRFAEQFVEFLVSNKILKRVRKSNTGPGWVLKLDKKHFKVITTFNEDGRIHQSIAQFFLDFLPEDKEIKDCIFS